LVERKKQLSLFSLFLILPPRAISNNTPSGPNLFIKDKTKSNHNISLSVKNSKPTPLLHLSHAFSSPQTTKPPSTITKLAKSLLYSYACNLSQAYDLLKLYKNPKLQKFLFATSYENLNHQENSFT
jgi:hypothetical protein